MKLKKSWIVLIAFVLLVLAGCGGSDGADSQSDVGVTTDPVEDVSTAAEGETEMVEESETQSAETTTEVGVFTIVPEESVARFEIDETLKSSQTGWRDGARITVEGLTSQLFGSMSFSPTDLSATEFDPIRIDASTFKTDNFYRTVAIQKTVLDSGSYPEISFVPTAINDLPASAEIGEQVVFNIDGDLTIRDISLEQNFVVTATLETADRLVGTAATVVTRESYGLEIIVAPHVTNVEDEVELFIDFVAIKN